MQQKESKNLWTDATFLLGTYWHDSDICALTASSKDPSNSGYHYFRNAFPLYFDEEQKEKIPNNHTKNFEPRLVAETSL